MKKLCFVIAVISAMILPVYAKLIFNSGEYPSDQPIEEYFAAEDQNYNKSIIYIFFNNYQDCYECPQTVALTEQIFNEYYNGKYSMFVINYEEDTEYDFASAYKLNTPLAIVLVKIQNGIVLGYKKISNPENIIQNGSDYVSYLRQFIDNYLGQEF